MEQTDDMGYEGALLSSEKPRYRVKWTDHNNQKQWMDFYNREVAIRRLNVLVLDFGIADAKLVLKKKSAV